MFFINYKKKFYLNNQVLDNYVFHPQWTQTAFRLNLSL